MSPITLIPTWINEVIRIVHYNSTYMWFQLANATFILFTVILLRGNTINSKRNMIMFYRIAVLENFAKWAREHVMSFFFSKDKGPKLQIY